MAVAEETIAGIVSGDIAPIPEMKDDMSGEASEEDSGD
jgi:hypothetical protein